MSQSAAQYTEWKQYLPRNFPIGIRALLVENDRACMETMKQTLIRAQFEVKACYKAIEAVSLLREKKESFDIIISDVHMPGMDGFELLQLVSLETNLPFILISADDRLNVMMRGLSLGATDYLIKPLRIEDLRHVWKHIAKTRLGDKEAPKYMIHDSLVNEEPKGSSNSKRKRTADNLNDNDDNNNDDDEPNNDGSSSKRTHMVWTSELQQKFLRAVNQVGIDKVGPNKILELMNAPGVTRKNVASHLQKYRAHWKKLDKAQQSEIIRFANASAARTAQRENLNFPPLCAPYQIPAQTLTSLESGILGRPSGSLSVPPMGHQNLQQTSMQGRPLMDWQTNMFNRFPHSKVAGSNNHLGGLNSSHRAINMQISQHPFSSQELNIFQGGESPVLLNQNSMEVPTGLLNSSPAQSNSVLMNQNSILVPSQPQFRFQAGNTPVSSNGNSWYDNGSTDFYHGLLSSQPTGIGRRLDENCSNVGVFSGSTIPESTSSLVPPCAVGSMPLQMSNICNTQDPGIVFGTLPGHEPEDSFGFLDKDPNEYLCDDIESPTNLG